MISGIVKHCDELSRLYEDVDGTLAEELKSMRGSDMGSFYSAIKAANIYYQNFPLANTGDLRADVDVDVHFSGEEVFGKYLDLNGLHLEFSNIIRKASIEQDYLQYLERFNSFFYLPDVVRQSRQFSEYLDHLWGYLANFFVRTNPLTDWEKVEVNMKKSFTTSVADKLGHANAPSSVAAKQPQPLRLGMFNTEQELEALGMERLKEALEALGLKCGGTLQDRAARLWSVRGKKPEDFPASLKAKDAGANKKRKLDGDASGSSAEFDSVSGVISSDLTQYTN